jgi:hypothetical protein
VVLVESVRVNGKPKQRHVAYLGGYYENELDHASARDEFWETVTNRLNNLSNRLSIEDRKKIEKAIAGRVSRPTKRQLEADRRRADKVLMKLSRSLCQSRES